MRETNVTVLGNVVDGPRVIETPSGLVLTKFRLASTPTWQRDGQWEKGTTSFFEVACFKKLGENVASSLVLGDGVIVIGRLEVREWTKDDRAGKEVQITASQVGHDLTFGITTLHRPGKAAPQPAVTEDFDEENTAAA